MPEIRCSGTKHGEVSDNSIGKFYRTCTSKFCKLRPDEVVLHIWDLALREENERLVKLIDTKRFKKPFVKGIENGNCD